MQLPKHAWSYISLHAGPWACMRHSMSLHVQFPELTWSSMSLYEVPWACMQFHELVCSSFLCLSSSQEFRSACLSPPTLKVTVFSFFLGWCFVDVMKLPHNSRQNRFNAAEVTSLLFCQLFRPRERWSCWSIWKRWTGGKQSTNAKI